MVSHVCSVAVKMPLSKNDSPNPDCDLVYSKADYVHNDVVVYPSHFEIPRLPYMDQDNYEADTGPDDGQSRVQIQRNETCDVDHQQRNNAPKTSIDSNKGRSDLQTDTLADFTNVYITRPPLVTVRDSSRLWYNFPWRVMQSYEGAKALLEQYTVASQQGYALRDRDLGNDLDGENWHALTYPGMIIELLDASGAWSSPASARSAPKRGHTCLLCGLNCSSQARLGSHTATHLKRQPCPTTCEICDHLQT